MKFFWRKLWIYTLALSLAFPYSTALQAGKKSDLDRYRQNIGKSQSFREKRGHSSKEEFNRNLEINSKTAMVLFTLLMLSGSILTHAQKIPSPKDEGEDSLENSHCRSLYSTIYSDKLDTPDQVCYDRNHPILSPSVENFISKYQASLQSTSDPKNFISHVPPFVSKEPKSPRDLENKFYNWLVFRIEKEDDSFKMSEILENRNLVNSFRHVLQWISTDIPFDIFKKRDIKKHCAIAKLSRILKFTTFEDLKKIPNLYFGDYLKNRPESLLGPQPNLQDEEFKIAYLLTSEWNDFRSDVYAEEIFKREFEELGLKLSLSSIDRFTRAVKGHNEFNSGNKEFNPSHIKPGSLIEVVQQLLWQSAAAKGDGYTVSFLLETFPKKYLFRNESDVTKIMDILLDRAAIFQVYDLLRFLTPKQVLASRYFQIKWGTEDQLFERLNKIAKAFSPDELFQKNEKGESLVLMMIRANYIEYDYLFFLEKEVAEKLLQLDEEGHRAMDEINDSLYFDEVMKKIPSSLLIEKDRNGDTLLHWWVRRADRRLNRALDNDDRYDTLRYSDWLNKLPSKQFLEKNNEGKTAVDLAFEIGQDEIIFEILGHLPAESFLENHDGVTLLSKLGDRHDLFRSARFVNMMLKKGVSLPDVLKTFWRIEILLFTALASLISIASLSSLKSKSKVTFEEKVALKKQILDLRNELIKIKKENHDLEGSENPPLTEKQRIEVNQVKKKMSDIIKQIETRVPQYRADLTRVLGETGFTELLNF